MKTRRFTYAILFGFTLVAFQNCGSPEHTSSGVPTSSVAPSTGVTLEERSLEIISHNCKSCHVDQALGGVTNLLNVNHLLDSNLIQPGNTNSQLLDAVVENRMPPGAPLSEADKTILRNWVLALGGMAPTGEPLDLNFTMTISTSLLPFQTRFAKVSRLPASPASTSLQTLRNNRILLGDYDYANSVVPKYSWEATDMKNWLESALPVCASSEVKTAYVWPQGMQNFLQATIGRQANSTEMTILNEIDAMSVTAAEKFEIFCLAVVSSVEFTSK